MGWSLGYDENWKRDIGYGVPAICDEPHCNESIDRGLGYVCGGEPYGGEHGCGLYFCSVHRYYSEDKECSVCVRCLNGLDPHEPKPDAREWIDWKLNDESWAQWRSENREWVQSVLVKEKRYVIL